MEEQNQLITLTADIVSAHGSNNRVAVGDVANLVQRVHEALSGLGQAPAEQEPAKKEPVVSIRASVKQDYIACMECRKRQKTLKRHLQTAHGMSPTEYRKDYGCQTPIQWWLRPTRRSAASSPSELGWGGGR